MNTVSMWYELNILPILRVSLAPRSPPLFCSSVCIHHNEHKQESGKKQERPRLIDHMNGREVDVGGKG